MMKNTHTNALKVLIVTGIYPTEERPHSGTFIKSQVDSLRDAGLAVEVVHPKPGPVPLRYLNAALQVFRKTWRGNFDIVHGHYGLWCLASRMQWTTPVVGSFLGDDLLGTPTAAGRFSKKSMLVVHVSRWLARKMQGVIVKSEEMKRATLLADAHVIPNGVDFDLFRPYPRAAARAALGWAQERIYVLFANDPTIPRKNFALAQAALARLQNKGIAAELVVANGLPQAVVAQYMQASNVLILPSLIEGSPNVVKEAMACNIPVVATDVGDVLAVIGKTRGCRVCPFDAEAFAEALEEAILLNKPTTGRADIRHLDRRVVARQVVAGYVEACRKWQKLPPAVLTHEIARNTHISMQDFPPVHDYQPVGAGRIVHDGGGESGEEAHEKEPL